MNNLEALIIVRGGARASAQMRTKKGQAALRVVENKIQSLLRKQAWRKSVGTTPIHMETEGFQYHIPDDPITAVLRTLIREDISPTEKNAALVEAARLLTEIDNVPAAKPPSTTHE